jgi:hypothetical protein
LERDSRIEKAPEVLKMLEYMLKNQQRYTVNDCFGFLTMVDLTNSLIEEIHLLDKLKGSSCIAETLHATIPLFFVSIEGKWIKFNDNEMPELCEVQFAEQYLERIRIRRLTSILILAPLYIYSFM